MAQPAPRKPKYFPKTHRGDGTYGWDERRRKVTLDWIHDGHRYKERGDTVVDVNEARDRRLAALEARAERVAKLSDGGQITAAGLLDEWYRFDCKGAPNTMVNYRASIGHLVAQFGDRRVADLTVSDVEKAYERLTIPLGAWSMHRIKTHLGMALDFAVRRQYAVTNVARGSRLPANMRRPKPADWFDRADFDTLRRHLVTNPSPANTCLLFQLLTGTRPGEALGLRWVNVDLDARTAKIASALQNQGRGRHIVVDDLKTAASYRTVELPADLVAALRALRPQTLLTGLVFTTMNGSPIHPANLRRDCTAACKAAGVPALSPKAMRHTLASKLLDLGVPAPAIARQLGHTNTRMLEMTYGHALDDVVPVAALLDAL